MTLRLPCVLCGAPSAVAVLCRTCLAIRCQCGHHAGDHNTITRRCLAIPACPCERLEVAR